jgi:aspartyl protease family protein
VSPDGPSLVYAIIALVFVASSLIGMRMKVGQAVKMLLGWLAIFGVGFIIFSFRSEFSSLGQRLRAEATGTPISQSGVVRIPISEDGHYWAWGKLNGDDVRFMIDSGASVTTVSRATAEAAGMTIGSEKIMVSTANGAASATRGQADSLAIGSIRREQFRVDVNDQDNINLLGMNFLASLQGWGVEGNYLVLRP